MELVVLELIATNKGYASMHYSSKDETGKKASQGVATPLLAGGRPTGWWSAERLAP
jgi:hypothetical protein